MKHILVLIFLILDNLFEFINCSFGDNFQTFQNCLKKCVEINCTTVDNLNNFYQSQPLDLWLTRWTCESECGYLCMWPTVDKISSQYNVVPQFYGKWPFVRYLGLQEPASVIFSLFNFLSFLYMAVTLYKRLHVPLALRRLWLAYSLLGLFTWTCSAVFHARDLPWTERMDYFCAFASILFGFYACLMRLVGHKSWWTFVVVATPLVAYFAAHVYYLSVYRFDYGYNMKAGVAFGLLNSVSWLIWCAFQFFYLRQKYVWRCAFVVTMACVLLSLELLDFPPFWWTFDAHSLWHLGTSPLPLFWTKFVLDDCHHLTNEEERKRKIV